MTDRALRSMIFLAAATISLGYGLSVVFVDYMQLPEYISDDAYYYLQIARVLTQEGLYSFDNGFSTNTGFHLLWFYIVAGLSLLTDGDTARLATAAVATSWFVSLAAVFITAAYCYRRYPTALIVIALMLSSYGFVNNHISAMEWPLCISISACLYMAVLSDRERGKGLIFLVLGILGVLARTDFPGVAVAFLAAAYLTKYLLRDPQFMAPARNLLIGALLAFLLVSLHNYTIAGDWLSTSARMKQHWSSAASVNPINPLFQFLRSVLYIAPLTGSDRVELRQQLLQVALLGTPLVIFLAAIFAFRLRAKLSALVGAAYRDSIVHPGIFCLLLTALFTVSGYLVVYSTNAMGMQSWYSAHVFVPIGFLLALTVHFFSGKSRKMSLLCTAIGVTIILTNFTIAFVAPPTYSHQSAMVETGLAVADAVAHGKLPNPVGISDAGIAGYFSNGQVVNLDGLVNSDIAGYFPQRLPCYLHDKGLEYAGGFGTTGLLGQAIEWQNFSQAYHYTSESGATLLLRKVNLENIERLYGCTAARLRR
jgi:hypothetical protein